ncbi:MAG: hypothetical protein HZB40_16035 [Rhodocyclales bacterium]|nr:hypothetical protein [Rhodocyclales bacterium]
MVAAGLFEAGIDPYGPEGLATRFIVNEWIEGKFAYAVIACPDPPGGTEAERARLRGLPAPRNPVVTMRWPEQISRGGRFAPYWWQLREAPRPPGGYPGEPDTLFLVLSPEVEIVSSLAFDGGLAGHRWKVNICTHRTQCRHHVPQSGESWRPAYAKVTNAYVKAQLDWVTLVDAWPDRYLGVFQTQPSPEQMTTEEPLLWLVVQDAAKQIFPPGDYAQIERGPGYARVWHDGPAQRSWEVEVLLDAPEQPGSFAVRVEGCELPNGSLYISHYRVRVVACGAVSVRVRQARFKNIFQEITGPDPNPWHKLLSEVQAEVFYHHDPAEMPFAGWEVSDDLPYRKIDPVNLGTTADWVANTVVCAGIEAVPVIGSVAEFGGLFYAAAYGRTWYGDEVSDGDLIAMGVFAVIGILPGVSSSALKGLKESGELLAPGKAVLA